MLFKSDFTRLILSRIQNDKKSRIKIILKIAQWTMAFSFAALIIASAIIRGFRSDISSKIFDFWGHIHFTSTDFIQSFESAPILIDDKFIQEVKTIKNFTPTAVDSNGEVEYGAPEDIEVKSITPFVTLAAMVESKEDFEGLFLKGVGEEHVFRSGETNYIIEGRYPDCSNEKKEILLSDVTASRIQVDVGDKILIHWIKNGNQKSKRLEVSGVYKTGLREYDKIFAFTSMDMLQDLQSWKENQVSGYEVTIDDAEKASLFNNYIFYELLPMEWFSTSVTQKFRNIFQWLKMQAQNELVLLLLLGSVVLINLATVLLILVIDRLKMIGILKSLGAENKSIKGIFLNLGLKLVLKALLWGNLIGLSLCYIQEYFQLIKLSEDDYYLSYAPIEINYFYLLVFNLVVIFAALLLMLIPISFISRIRPLKILSLN